MQTLLFDLTISYSLLPLHMHLTRPLYDPNALQPEPEAPAAVGRPREPD